MKVIPIETGFVDLRVVIEWVMIQMVIVPVRVSVRAGRVKLLLGYDCVVTRVRVG